MSTTTPTQLSAAISRSKRDTGHPPGTDTQSGTSGTAKPEINPNSTPGPNTNPTTNTMEDVVLATIKAYLQDVPFIRGFVYTSLPITVASLILLAAYKHDIKTSRSTSSVTFKWPLIVCMLFALAAPFIVKATDDKLVAMII